MREVNLAGVDLNLLPALEALIRRRNVTRAGEDVGLSQPAMSRALARLRALLGDPILVKAPGGLAPTARAQALLPQLSRRRSTGSAAWCARRLSTPARSTAAFRIAATDVQALLLGPPLLAKLRGARAARRPGVRAHRRRRARAHRDRRHRPRLRARQHAAAARARTASRSPTIRSRW